MTRLKTSLLTIGMLLSVVLLAQTPEEDKTTLIPVLITDYKYNDETDLLSSDSEQFKIGEFSLLTIGDNKFALIWIQSSDNYARFNEVRLCRYRYLPKKKTYEKMDEDIVSQEITNTVHGATIDLSNEREVIEITSGYDSDGDGDDVNYFLYTILEDRLTRILALKTRTSSGDGCDGDNSESTMTYSDEITDGFPNLNVEEASSTFNNCDENNEESCTRNSRWSYSWNGSVYVKN